MFTPPIKISPSVTSYSLGIKLTKELFPQPVEPIIPIVSPSFALKDIFSNTFSLFLLYLNETFLNSISNSFTSLASI